MCRALLIVLISFAAIGDALAQSSSDAVGQLPGNTSNSVVACKTEAAAVKLIKSTSQTSGSPDDRLLRSLINNGACLVLQETWEVGVMADPPTGQAGDHAAKWTVRTPVETIHLWSFPSDKSPWNSFQVVCQTKDLMAKWMDATAANQSARDDLFKSGACSHVLYDAIKEIGTPGPVQVKVHTSKGIETRWSSATAGE